MSNSPPLRQLLSQVDSTAPAIQAAASAMMKHYNTSAGVAVNEWRNSLSACRLDQLLPLLYVANEVLQISKRNRGARFLEAMSAHLGASLQHICQRDGNVVEKVRRTVKIWGDRRVFSVRFVNELLTGLEPYRVGGAKAPGSGSKSAGIPPPSSLSSPSGGSDNNANGASFSPQPSDPDDDGPKDKKKSSNNNNDSIDDDDDDPMDIFNDDDSDKGKKKNKKRKGDDDGDNASGGSDDDDDKSDDDDDDKNIFGSSGPTLDLDIPLDSLTAVPSTAVGDGEDSSSKNNANGGSKSSAKKRKRSGDHNNDGSNKRKLTLSSNNLVGVWTRLIQLQQSFHLAQLTCEKIHKALHGENGALDPSELEGLVGDELQNRYKDVLKYQEQLVAQRKIMRDIAQERHELEQLLASRYLPWLEAAAKQDDADVALCETLQSKIRSFREIHAAMKQAQYEIEEEERKQRELLEDRERKRREEEESERFRRAALAKETEAKPGMVWNPTTREYMTLNTDESWRD